MERRDTPAFSRRRNSSASRAFGSQGRSEGYDHPQSPPHQGVKGAGSEVTVRRLESEGDIRCQTERGMAGRVPAERLWDKVGVDPVDQAVEGPGVGEELVPSQEPVLGGAGRDQEELGRSLLIQAL